MPDPPPTSPQQHTTATPNQDQEASDSSNPDYPLSYIQIRNKPHFDGSSRISTATNNASPGCRYVAAECAFAMAQFRCNTQWNSDLLGNIESGLRILAQHLTPTPDDRSDRLFVINKLRFLVSSALARMATNVDIVGFGSFVAGLYTPTGDLDLCITGTDFAGTPISQLPRDHQIRCLRRVQNHLRSSRDVTDLNVLAHARVPIAQFRDRYSNIEVDVAVNGYSGLYKSAIIGLITHYDWRAAALVRLVKMWARHHDINDAAFGTFNSFALTLMVVFHLQTREVPVLPPLEEMFRLYKEESGGGTVVDWDGIERRWGVTGRPMESGGSGFSTVDQAFKDDIKIVVDNLKREAEKTNTPRNNETLLELLSSFFVLYKTIITKAWLNGDEALARALRNVRVCTWKGHLVQPTTRWPRHADTMLFSVEDPFDSQDNCSRTIRERDIAQRIAKSFQKASNALLSLRNAKDVRKAFLDLFGEINPQLTSVIFLDQPVAFTLPNQYGEKATVDIYPPVNPGNLWFPGVIQDCLPDWLPRMTFDEGPRLPATTDGENNLTTPYVFYSDGDIKTNTTPMTLEKQIKKLVSALEPERLVHQANVDREEAERRAEEERRRAAKAAKQKEKNEKREMRRQEARLLRQQQQLAEQNIAEILSKPPPISTPDSSVQLPASTTAVGSRQQKTTTTTTTEQTIQQLADLSLATDKNNSKSLPSTKQTVAAVDRANDKQKARKPRSKANRNAPLVIDGGGAAVETTTSDVQPPPTTTATEPKKRRVLHVKRRQPKKQETHQGENGNVVVDGGGGVATNTTSSGGSKGRKKNTNNPKVVTTDS